MTGSDNGVFIEFAKKVGIICGAGIAGGTVLAWAWSLIMQVTLAPLVERVDANASRISAGVTRDSLMLLQVQSISVDVERMGEAMRYEVGDPRRDRILNRLTRD